MDPAISSQTFLLSTPHVSASPILLLRPVLLPQQ
jgi:hypothetical protein